MRVHLIHKGKKTKSNSAAAQLSTWILPAAVTFSVFTWSTHVLIATAVSHKYRLRPLTTLFFYIGTTSHRTKLAAPFPNNPENMASKDKAFCTICASQVSSLRISPKGHERAHGEDERACDECWEAWLSMQVEENRPEDIQCIFCNSIIDFEQLASYAWKGTHNR